MSITDELRKWASVEVPYKYGHQLTAIADRIDAEHERTFRNLTDALHKQEDATRELDEKSVLLPADADGEYIHIGDELDVGFVARIVITDDEWPPYLYAYKETPHILTQHFCNEVSHYRAPTVEDVLREFALAVCKDDALTIREGVVEEYAKRLTLAEGEDA